MWEKLSSDFADNKGTDQLVLLRSVISAFVIRLLESIISKLTTSKISLFLLVSVAEQTGLGMNWSETQKTDFLALSPIRWQNM